MPRTRCPYCLTSPIRSGLCLELFLVFSEKRGRPPKWPASLVANAVFYLLRSGSA